MVLDHGCGGFFCGPALSLALVSSNDLASGWCSDPPLEVEDFFSFYPRHGFFTSTLGKEDLLPFPFHLETEQSDDKALIFYVAAW